MTKYIKREEINDEVILEVGSALREGKLVVFPTDTVYGLGTNAYFNDACQKIYDVKGRPSYKPLTLLISDIDMLKDMVSDISHVEEKLINTFWPGPLTIKFKKKLGVFPDIVSAGDDYIRVRLINDSVTSKFIDFACVPVVAPSANISGHETGTKIDNIINELGGKVDYIIDCGDIESDEVSTIVQVENEEIILIREGKIKREQLSKISFVRDL